MTVAMTARWCIKFIVVQQIGNGVGCNESERGMKWFEQEQLRVLKDKSLQIFLW